jgi:hypothetical protein
VFISLQTLSHLASTVADAVWSLVTASWYDFTLAWADAPRLPQACAVAALHPPFASAALATAAASSRPGTNILPV